MQNRTMVGFDKMDIFSSYSINKGYGSHGLKGGKIFIKVIWDLRSTVVNSALKCSEWAYSTLVDSPVNMLACDGILLEALGLQYN